MADLNLQDDQVYRNHTSAKLTLVIGLLFFVLIGRLYYIQISQYKYHFRLSEENRLRLKILEAPRGLILSRKGEILARNRPSYQVAILPTELKDKETVFQNLMKIRDTLNEPIFDSSQVNYMMERGRWRPFEALPILEDASIEVVSMIEEHQLDLPGVVVNVESRREYPYETAAAHALGYTAEISEKEFDDYKTRGYRLGNRVGAKGLEKYYEDILRGKEGKKFVEVNVYGKEVGLVDDKSHEPAQAGRNILTTLDLDLQLTAEEAIADTVKAAVVALDPRNGEILVMLSSPRINGNIFSLSKKRRSKEWAKLALDPRRPLNNRASIGIYDPGSTFKAMTSMAGFRTGKVAPNYSGFKPCRGGFQFGRRYQKCWKPSGHGYVNFFSAFQHSCDTYYYQVGLTVGMDAINKVARNFGFGKKTGVDLVAERSGILMDSAFYEKKFASRGWKWSRGMILNLAIGQGQLVTPLQLANMAAGLGNGNVIYRPHLLKEVRDFQGGVLERYTPQVLQELEMSEEEHQNMLKAMQMVIDPGGTGGRARVKDVIVGGKTGSAENPHGEKTHALFMAVAPLHNPEIAIGVVVENMGHGGSIAAPIAGKILNRYFYRDSSGSGT